jgi:outer membrane protein, heavy metal efflux system
VVRRPVQHGCWYGLLVILVGCQTPAERHQSFAVTSPMPTTPVTSADRFARNGAQNPGFSEKPWVLRRTDRPPLAASTAKQPSRVVLASALAEPDRVTQAIVSGDSKKTAKPPSVDVGGSLPSDQNSRLNLSLRGAVETGLMQNPDLVALRTQEGVSLAALGVAETYPWNPNFQGQFLGRGNPSDNGTSPGSGFGKPNYQLIIMQQFELAHQQRHREGNAAALLNQVRWTIKQAELTNVATTTQFYFTALYQKQIRDLARETAALDDKLLGVVQRRFKAGQATVADVTTAKIGARQSHRQEKLAEANFRTAMLALRRQLNLPLDATLVLTDSLADFEWLSASDPDAGSVRVASAAAAEMQLKTGQAAALAARLVEGRPDVVAALAGVDAARANERLARAARVPDLQAGPLYQTGDNGVKFAGLGVQIDIPVWNTGAPLARQRRAELHQQAVTYEQLKQRAIQEAATAIDRYERARKLVAESRVDLSPLSGKTPPEIEKITAQFQAGQATILQVFMVQNSLLQEQRTHLDLLNELAQASAGVILATGLLLERLMKPRRTAPVPPTPAL